MRKLSNITESIWSDIQKRSSGETIRKEDDVDNLDMEGFYDYLKSHYKTLNSFVNITNSLFFNRIDVPVLIQDGVVFNVHFKYTDNKYIFIESTIPHMVKGLFSKLEDKFSLKKDSESSLIYIISPKDNSKVTNTFFIEVVDFITDSIPDYFERGVKKIINESIWSDIQKRSAGESVRKEDNVNLLDPEEFVEYLKKHYIYQKSVRSYVGYEEGYQELYILFAPTKTYGGNYTLSLDYKSGEITFAYDIQKTYPEIFEKLNDRFKLTKIKNKFMYYAIEFDREATNSLFLEVVDFVVDMNDKNILLKRR